MRKVLLTGFGPFGHYQYNPTKDLVQRLNGRKLSNAFIIGQILPCSYKKAAEIAFDLVEKYQPDMVLSFGLASRVPAIRLETRGRNIMDSQYTDIDGQQFFGTPICPGSREYYYTSVEADSLAKELNRAGINSEVSVDAEGFICNSLIYLLGKKLSSNYKQIPFIFFHVPWTKTYSKKISLEPGKIMIPETYLDKTVAISIKMLSKQN
ncbi:MAG: pyroglutamyl-peptidase I [Patescibacteria group bacterium]|nr:pyroglutamyl-peptidase I [Patescibacteria group bacterium]MCL5093708.1 pyroglutamyl-peptidase I [Patescibacteria group bacterium]